VALTDKQKRFVTEYLVDQNAAAAYRRAKYACKNDNVAKVEGHRLLTNPNIASAIAAGQKKREEKTGITAEWALRRLQQEAELTGDGSSHSARVSALNLAMKHLGMLKEDAPHPDRPPVDMKQLTDHALDRILDSVGPLLSGELRALCGPGEGEPATAS
jgi:phage terminase small subunit